VLVRAMGPTLGKAPRATTSQAATKARPATARRAPSKTGVGETARSSPKRLGKTPGKRPGR
jgi:hypothetical protein